MRVRAKRLELPSREEFLRFVEETNGRRGGYAGGQAEYLRVPHADVGPIKIESGLPDEKVLFLSDIFPTGYMAAENAEIEPGDTVAIWGCGPVSQFAIRSAWMFGAGRVIAIDRVAELRARRERSHRFASERQHRRRVAQHRSRGGGVTRQPSRREVGNQKPTLAARNTQNS